MAFTHIDLVGLNKYDMHDAPIVSNDAELKVIAQKSKDAHRSISIAGMRHSQGGHTALSGENMVFTEAMKQSIVVAEDYKTVEINAGATWSDLHFELAPKGLAPLVHQSSPHFSIGGSLSVDCHGRSVHDGALSNTVESLTILTNKAGEGLKETTASRTINPDLFFAALGGYGACGVILNATLRITQNIRLYKLGKYIQNLPKLSEYLHAASKGERNQYDRAELRMFYAWMNVSHENDSRGNTKYLNHAMVYEYVPVNTTRSKMKIKELKNENWATTEVMRAGWVAGRRSITLRGELFNEIAKMTTHNPFEDYLINFLREEISFTSTKGEATNVDLLQEFFIPLARIEDFLNALKAILPITYTDVQVLSCTLRVIKPPPSGLPGNQNNKPFLSYADNALENTAMVSVALELKVNKETTDNAAITIHPDYKVNANAISKIQKIINQAISLGGTYYLPYYQVADLTEFKTAYPRHAQWKAQADIWNPAVDGKRAFNNEFLKAYLR